MKPQTKTKNLDKSAKAKAGPRLLTKNQDYDRDLQPILFERWHGRPIRISSANKEKGRE